MFAHIDYYPGDPILSLMDKFVADSNPHKVNLGIGVYYDEAGKLPVLECVKTAERMIADPVTPRPYLPMAGLLGHRVACQNLLFGQDSKVLAQKRVATIATLGGSGALKVGAEFIREWFPQSKCYVSDPTWSNHIAIFAGCDIEVGSYPYYDNATSRLKFEAMLDFIDQLNPYDVVLMHPCCHNPTGMDLSTEQWDKVLDIIKQRQLIPFMDMAYQGFGEDMEQDAYAIRKAADMGLPVFVSNSFSKNLSLYGERVGGLSVVCPTSDEAERVFGQLNYTVRRIYTSPPSHGGHVVDIVMNDEELQQQWVSEVYGMRDRIQAMRLKLKSVLEAKLPEHNFDYLTRQKGMFSFTGLTAAQIERLQNEFGVYLVSNSRMCMAGLNVNNVDYVAESIASVLTN
ncbi:amino acid aminotransferase [uncultured Psychrobacter sp.]|uniref:amino acid aminotransferase n=1 Tax=uncultured Psychrobacter sp. TaxID=259303 RepID=UPI00262C5672|nr:amino acid aminotransferase [uncultured Psychrobacter sp.]